MSRILVVDDEIGIRELLAEILTDESFDVTLAESAAAAKAARSNQNFDLVLLDVWMPDIDGITLLKDWAANGQLTMPVIMMSGHGTIDTAIEATRQGALDFLEKPIGMQKLVNAVKRALNSGRKTGAIDLSLAAFPRSIVLRDLKRRLEQVILKNPLLLLKTPPGGIVELVARTLVLSGRAWHDLTQDNQPLTLEALQALRGGVLYCEELTKLSRLQQKNLAFATEKCERAGFRLVVGSTLDEHALAAQGWDEAVLHRLFEVWLSVPKLAVIHDEIPDIASHLLQQYVEAGVVPLRRFSSGALNVLRQNPWADGYAELKRAVRTLALIALEEEISAEEARQQLNPAGFAADQPPELPAATMALPLREAREIFERLYFEYHLARENGSMTRLAEKSGLERTHLYRKLKDLGLRNGRQDDDV